MVSAHSSKPVFIRKTFLKSETVMNPKFDFQAICSQFRLYGDFVSVQPYGNGHINDTYQLVYCQSGKNVRYILQRINTNVFKNPVSLMDNIQRVTDHLQKKCTNSRGTLTLILTEKWKPYVVDEDGNYWRVYLFIEDAGSYDVIENEKQAYEAAKVFGQFQADLVDIPGPRLIETIPDFHNTPSRVAALEKAVREDKCGRAASVQKEIDFVLSRKEDAGLLLDLNRQGLILERITHNDTKLNNVLIDNATGTGICVIDLDTVMPGLAHYDFGDMVRTGTSPAPEDETDLSKVTMQFNMFEALLRGYCASAGNFLNDVELEHLPFSGKLITLEIGTRFLTDYLEGDIYFKVHRDGHNLDRCRTQFKLVESIEQQYDRMMKLVGEIRKDLKK